MGKSISLIMPAYNKDKHIESAVRSAINKFKEHNFDYEILIFDDASTDNTGKVADKLALEDSKIKVVHNSKNMNLGFNFTHGITMANKEFTGLLPYHSHTAIESFDNLLIIFGYCT